MKTLVTHFRPLVAKLLVLAGLAPSPWLAPVRVRAGVRRMR
jgi:hypothetical protein